MPPMRASDRVRAGTVAALRRGYLDGRLSADTFEARLGVALTAKRRRALWALVADLRLRARAARALAVALDEAPAAPAPPIAARATILLSRAAVDEVTVGRSRDATLRLASPAVSRHHARFERRGGGWHVTDLASTNGTFVDGVRVERAPVAAGAEVRLGDAVLRVA
jgi:hypothetical protein